jgi:hypothetical protein
MMAREAVLHFGDKRRRSFSTVKFAWCTRGGRRQQCFPVGEPRVPTVLPVRASQGRGAVGVGAVLPARHRLLEFHDEDGRRGSVFPFFVFCFGGSVDPIWIA